MTFPVLPAQLFLLRLILAVSDLMREPAELLLRSAAVIALGSLAAAGRARAPLWAGRRAPNGSGGGAGEEDRTPQASPTQLDEAHSSSVANDASG